VDGRNKSGHDNGEWIPPVSPLVLQIVAAGCVTGRLVIPGRSGAPVQHTPLIPAKAGIRGAT
jgi:hypothetical protein